jgi:hypothetical protein
MDENYMKQYIELSKEFKANRKSQETIAKIYALINILEKEENNEIILVYLYKLLVYHKKAYDLYLKIYDENDRKQKVKLAVMKQMSESHSDNSAIKLRKKIEVKVTKTIYYCANGFVEKDCIEDLLYLYAKNITSEKEFSCFEEYVNLRGAAADEIVVFENNFNITLPEDLRDYYKIKNGSANFQILHLDSSYRWNRFYMFPLEIIKFIKDRLPYIDKEFIPFAVSRAGGNSRMHGVYLLLDTNIERSAEKGEIVYYAYDDYDMIKYIASTFSDLLEETKDSLINGKYTAMKKWPLLRWYEWIGLKAK